MQYALGFLTKKQKDQLVNNINEPIYNWCRDWIDPQSKPIIRIKDFSNNYQDLIINKGVFAVDGMKSIFFLIQNKSDCLRIFFKGIEKDLPLDNIANFLLGKAMSDLLYKIDDNLKDIHNIKKINNIEFLGVPVIVEINLDFGNIELVLDSNMFENTRKLDPLVADNPLNLVAISNEITSLSVSFPLDKLSMTEFLDLQVGDVIKSKHSIVEPFKISCGNKEVAVGSLGQLENQLAILLSSKEENRQ